jgi:[histone H3]-lysine36 N-dimethyltransferase SETMAR
MENIEKRAVIKFFVKKGLKPIEIHNEMVSVLGDDAPSKSMVFKWALQFRRGRESIEDDCRSGRPIVATCPKMINAIRDMVMDDRRMTLNQISETMEISTERVFHILKEDLGFRKLCARWVPHSLNFDQKELRSKLCTQHLALFQHNKTDFKRGLLQLMKLGSTTMILY